MVAIAGAPRVYSLPDYDDASLGEEAIELSASAGLILDEHQQLVIRQSMTRRDDGRFAAFEVGVVEPRQNGKGGILEARELAGIAITREDLIIHSAHEYATSLEAFYRMQVLLENSDLGKRVRKVRNAHGEQGFDFIGGQRIRYRTRTRGGGRGFSCQLLLLDEAMFLPEFAHAALMPTLSAQENPQIWYTGSAVDQEMHEHGVVLARIRERGLSGEDPSLAYFEWSLPYEHPSEIPDDVAESEDAWLEANPALGIRISPEHIANEQRSMAPRTFAVERLGVGDWPRTDGEMAGPISAQEWAALADPKSKLRDPVALAFDVSPDRRCTISAAGRNAEGRAHLEVVDSRQGTAWLKDRAVVLAQKHKPIAFVCDGYGPGASLVAEVEIALRDIGFELTCVTATQHAQACGLLVDAVAAKTVTHLADQRMMAAIRGSATRPLSDSWAWSRRSSTADITPLVSGTLALWGLAQEHSTGVGIAY